MLTNLTKLTPFKMYGASAIAISVASAIGIAILILLTSGARAEDTTAPVATEPQRAPVTAVRGMAFIEANTFLPDIVETVRPDVVPATTTRFLEMNSFLPEISQTDAPAFELKHMLFMEWNAGFDQQDASVAREVEPISGPR